MEFPKYLNSLVIIFHLPHSHWCVIYNSARIMNFHHYPQMTPAFLLHISVFQYLDGALQSPDQSYVTISNAHTCCTQSSIHVEKITQHYSIVNTQMQ